MTTNSFAPLARWIALTLAVWKSRLLMVRFNASGGPTITPRPTDSFVTKSRILPAACIMKTVCSIPCVGSAKKEPGSSLVSRGMTRLLRSPTRFKTIIQQWGGEAILPYHYGGSNGFLADEFIDNFYFATLGASRMAKTLCAAPSTAVAQDMYGRMPGVAFEDYVHAKCIIIWGANPKATNIHLVPLLRQAKKNGAFIAVVNPMKTFSDHEIDLHLPVYPGTDLPVALAMIRLWQEAERFDLRFSVSMPMASSHYSSKRKHGRSNAQQQKLAFLPKLFAPWRKCTQNRLLPCSAPVGEQNVIVTGVRPSQRFSRCQHYSASSVCAVVGTP